MTVNTFLVLYDTSLIAQLLLTCLCCGPNFTKDNSNRQFVSQFLGTGISETPKVITNINEQDLFQVFLQDQIHNM